MIICILGDSLTSLSLAKNLVNKKLKVDVFSNKKNKSKSQSSRTIGLTHDSINFFNKEIIRINPKLLWKINKIEIFSDKDEKDKILNFENEKKNLFSIVKNDDLYNLLNVSLSKNKYFKKKLIKDNLSQTITEKYDLIINCDPTSSFSKKFFFKKISKEYKNRAFATIAHHKKFNNNHIATQVFTKKGPIAFLPISNFKTSIVFSIKLFKKKLNDQQVFDLIKKYNFKYSIKKFETMSNAELKFLSLRNYYYKNILAFGDLLHKIHPLAGQGFNMTVRDIRALSKIINNKIDIGLSIDSSVASEFEKKVRHKNFIFSTSVDFIYEFFNLETKFKNDKTIKILKFLGNKDLFRNSLIKFANRGIKN